MRMYTPDRWVVLKLGIFDGKPLYKVFAGWYGGFAGSDSWKLNSGITEIRDQGAWLEFDGYSGSTYCCHKEAYGMTGLQLGILRGWQDSQAARGDVPLEILDLDAVLKL